MGHIPPKTVGSKSPMARSSIFTAPSTVRIVVPFRKQLLPCLLLLLLLLSLLLLLLSANTGVVLAIIADANRALILMRLRRELWRPVSGFSRPGIFSLLFLASESTFPSCPTKLSLSLLKRGARDSNGHLAPMCGLNTR